MRFRRSIKLAPGFRLNLSGSGLSASVGPRGASMTFGRKGTFFNAGIPGTGLSSRQRVGGGQSASTTAAPSGKVTVNARAYVDDDGEVRYVGPDGAPLSDYLIDQAKRQQGTAIRGMIEQACEEINSAGKRAAEIHLDTPAPTDHPTFEPGTFNEFEPRAPIPKAYGFLERVFKGRAKRVDEENAAQRAAYEQKLAAWKDGWNAFLESEQRRRNFLEVEVRSDPNAMAAYLEGILQDMDWPRETSVDFEIQEGGQKVMLDVDLPEIEDMPKRSASLPARGYKITMKELSAAKIQKQYMEHVHGLGFKVIGEVFAALPTVQLVVLSAYSQRPDKASGAVKDEYLYSVRVPRAGWQKIDFGNLGAIDVIQALAAFELRREMTKTGTFRPIEPFAS